MANHNDDEVRQKNLGIRRVGIWTWSVGYWVLDVGFPCCSNWVSLEEFSYLGGKRKAKQYIDKFPQ